MSRYSANPNVLSLESEMSDMNITPPPSPRSSAPGNITVAASTNTDHTTKGKINDVEMQTNKMNTAVSPASARGSAPQDIHSPTRNERSRMQPNYLRNPPTQPATNTSNNSTIAAASKITISSPARRPDQGYQFFRTHSSPSIIDASPKSSFLERVAPMSSIPSPLSSFRGGGLGTRTGPGMGTHKYELTPVMRNTSLDEETGDSPNNANLNNGTNTNDNNLNSLSFPETNFFDANTTRRDIADDNNADDMNSPSSRNQQQHRYSLDGINRNSVNIRPRITPNHHHLNLDPPFPSTTRLVSPVSFRESQCMPPPPPPPIPSSMALNGTEMMDEGAGGDEQRYSSPPSNTLLTQPIPLGRNCHSLTSPNEYKWRQQAQPETSQLQTQQQQSAVGGYAVPPSSPTSPSQDDIGGVVSSDHLSPQEYMVPYQPSRDSSLASYGVATDDVDGIFLAPRRRRKQRQQARACGRGENSRGDVDDDDDDEDECMEAWGRDRSVGGGEDDGSIASSSIPSIRMAVRLNSSTITHDEQDDGSVFDTYESGYITFNSENDANNQQQLYTVHPHRRQYHPPLDMAVTPSPPRRAFRKEMAGILSNRDGEEVTGQIHNEAMEWLKTVEVGRNNQYVAEAASSKFLTGKQTHPATKPSNMSNNLMNGPGGGRGATMMNNVYNMRERVHSTDTPNHSIMMMAGRQRISSSTITAPVAENSKQKRCAPSATATVSVAAATRTNGLATSGAVGASNARRTQEVMGRSTSMFHGPGRGGYRSSRGTKGVSRTRASAMMR